MPVNERRAAWRRCSPALLLASVGVFLLATPSPRPRGSSPCQSSNNWAGYADTASFPAVAVSGSWMQPAVTCGQPSPTYSAFWVGLGGFPRLEAPGADRHRSRLPPGRGSHTYAWIEIVPAPSVRLPLKVRPSDKLAAHVTVSARRVLLRIQNLTTTRSTTRTASMQSPDTRSGSGLPRPRQSAVTAAASRCR